MQDLIRSLFIYSLCYGKLIVPQNFLCRDWYQSGSQIRFLFLYSVPRVSDRYAQGSRTPGCHSFKRAFLRAEETPT